ncbi:MAG: type II secretion system F family protein [Elusimicrobiales bacterium]
MGQAGLLFNPQSRVQSKQHSSVSSEDITAFFEHMSTLLNSGVPLLRAITLASEQAESSTFQKALRDIGKKISGGSSFYESAAIYPKYFPNQAIQLIRTGEQSGQLAPLLTKLSEDFKKRAAIGNKVKSALIYPAIMLCVAVGAIFIMLWKVIPNFAQFFQDFGKKLPPVTQFVLDASNFVQGNWYYMIGGAGVAFFSFRAFAATEFGARQVYAFAMSMPILGELVVQSAMESFSSNMSLLMKSGMPMLEAIASTQETMSANPLYRDALKFVHQRVSTGSDLGGSLHATGFFTNLAVGMVKMGEESGKLSDVLEVLAIYYADKVETLTMRLTGLMEPVIVIGMGVVVAGMLASVYLPMFQLSGG